MMMACLMMMECLMMINFLMINNPNKPNKKLKPKFNPFKLELRGAHSLQESYLRVSWTSFRKQIRIKTICPKSA